MASVLLDLQDRGQLAAGLSSYDPNGTRILDTYRGIGTVIEAFLTSHPGKHRATLAKQTGRAPPVWARPRAYLIRKIAWRLQANAEGDLPARARHRVMNRALTAFVRLSLLPRITYATRGNRAQNAALM